MESPAAGNPGGRSVSALAGRVAVVTGASRGVGKGIARALGEQGSIVQVTGRTSGARERTIKVTAKPSG